MDESPEEKKTIGKFSKRNPAKFLAGFSRGNPCKISSGRLGGITGIIFIAFCKPSIKYQVEENMENKL